MVKYSKFQLRVGKKKILVMTSLNSEENIYGEEYILVEVIYSSTSPKT